MLVTHTGITVLNKQSFFSMGNISIPKRGLVWMDQFARIVYLRVLAASGSVVSLYVDKLLILSFV